MAHDSTDLRVRTKKYALREAQVIREQVLRSAASVGGQYREACRAKSPADFISAL